jgi:hypothetical protein
MSTLNVVESIFMAALERGTPEARAIYLAEVCKDDVNLRRCVECLLTAHGKADVVIPTQAPDLPARIEPAPIEERPGSNQKGNYPSRHQAVECANRDVRQRR